MQFVPASSSLDPAQPSARVNETLAEWGAVAQGLADTVVAHKMSTDNILTGVQAFLMAMEASGHADAAELAEELFHMSEYFHSVSEAERTSIAAA